MRHPNTARQLLTHETRSKDLTPRVKLAARLYATGIAKTKAAAADMAGLSRTVFYITSTTEPKVSDLIRQIDDEIASEKINTGKLLERLGRRAVRNIAQIMEAEATKDDIRLKAAQDLADRSPETSKVLKIDQRVAAISISDDNLAAMREAMLESAKLRMQFPDAAAGKMVTTDDATTAAALEIVKDAGAPLLGPGSDEEDNT